MLKHMIFKKIFIYSLFLLLFFLIYIFPKEDIPSNKANTNNVYTSGYKTPIYLFNKSANYISRVNVESSFPINNIEQIIDFLTTDNKKSLLLPAAFSGTIAKDTKLLDYSIHDGVLRLNFSHNFILSKNIQDTISSILFSICDFSNLCTIEISIEGTPLNKYNESLTFLPDFFDRSFGINNYFDINFIKGAKKVTLYYNGQNNDYVPITKTSNNNKEAIEIIVEELKTSPTYRNNLVSYLNVYYELSNYEIMENIAEVSFNNNMLDSYNSDQKLEEVKYAVALSVRDTYMLDRVSVNINP